MALLEAVKNGKANFLATDHAPHPLPDKLSDKPPSGVPLLDTYGGFVTWLLQDQNVSAQTIHSLACANPAIFLGIEDRGHLNPGARADLTILNLRSPWTVSPEDLSTKCAWSPFEGVTFPGRVEAVMVEGQFHR